MLAQWHMLQIVSADDTNITITLPSTKSEIETTTYSNLDAAVINTSFEVCSISRSLKSKLTQAVEACRKILKTANIRPSNTKQESTAVKICDEQDNHFTKKVKEKIERSDHFAKPLVRSYNQLTEVPKSNFSL